MTEEYKDARNASFLKKVESRELTHLLYAGKAHWEEIQAIRKKKKELGYYMNHKVIEMSRDELMTYTVTEHFKKASVILKGKVLGELPMEQVIDHNLHGVGSVGLLMSRKLIAMTGTEAQKAAWLPNLDNQVWLTCYAQTELAHGSDVQSLKTKAVYDPVTKDLVIHTPDLEAMKWWPGDLNIYSTHITLMAELVVDGKSYGSRSFFFEIRNPETHMLHKGVELGDIGPKLGFNSKDNSFVKFDHFHVPLDSLLGKYIYINPEGKVVERGNPKILYAGMMEMRTKLLIYNSHLILKHALIATRYSMVRKQFKSEENVEMPIFDYQLQKAKLVKQISRGYAAAFATQMVVKHVKKNEAKIQKGDFKYMKDVHIEICGHKALITEWSVIGASEMIRACGGHGYSSFAGIAFNFTEQFADVILEGENSVLLLQISAALLKALNNLRAGRPEKVKGQFEYLKEDLTGYKLPESKQSFRNFHEMRNALDAALQFHLRQVGSKMFELIQEGHHPKDAWNQFLGSRIYKIGRLHALSYMCKNVDLFIQENCSSPKTRSVLENMLRYLYIGIIEEELGSLVEAGVVNHAHMLCMEQAREELLEEISVHALVLCEALQLEDEFLGSAIAHSNGNPYQNLYEQAKELGRLNQFVDGIHPALKEIYHPWKKEKGLVTYRKGEQPNASPKL